MQTYHKSQSLKEKDKLNASLVSIETFIHRPGRGHVLRADKSLIGVFNLGNQAADGIKFTML